MDATLKATEAMLKPTSSLTEELTSFACQRLRTEPETGRSLMNSGNDSGQAINLQSQCAADAMREYLEEMTRIARLAEQTTRGVWDKKGRLLRRPKLAPEGAANLQSRRQREVP